MSEMIAGAVLPDFSSDVPPLPPIGELEKTYLGSLDAAKSPMAKWLSGRFHKVSLPDGRGDYILVVDRPLLDYLEERVADPAAPTEAEFLRYALEQPGSSDISTAVDPTFRADALNAINTSYFAAPIAFTPEAGLATLYTDNKPLNRALGVILSGAVPGGRGRIKELCSGNNTEHWRYIAEGANSEGVRGLDVTLTDFVRPIIHAAIQSRGLTATAETYSLFDPLEVLPPADRYNALITTYGFDSVWLPEDLFLTRDKDKWYQTLFRVKVADWNPRQQELLAAMRQGEALPNATVDDYEGIVVEEALQPFDIADHPYAEYLDATPQRRFMFPGGLIRRVVEAFDGQLDKHGLFISADIGNFGSNPESTQAYAKSGVAAHYHDADYVLAETILQKEHGLNAQLYGLEDIADYALGRHWKVFARGWERAPIVHGDGSGVMIVSRN